MPDDKSSSAPPLSKGRVFARRLFSFVVLWSIILGAMFSGNDLLSNGVFLVIIILLAATGIIEFYGMAEKRGISCFKYCGLIGGILLMVGTFLNLTGQLGRHDSPARVNDFETSFLILFV
jgi:hypothetical protein